MPPCWSTLEFEHPNVLKPLLVLLCINPNCWCESAVPRNCIPQCLHYLKTSISRQFLVIGHWAFSVCPMFHVQGCLARLWVFPTIAKIRMVWCMRSKESMLGRYGEGVGGWVQAFKNGRDWEMGQSGGGNTCCWGGWASHNATCLHPPIHPFFMLKRLLPTVCFVLCQLSCCRWGCVPLPEA